MTILCQGLSSLTPGGWKMRDPGTQGLERCCENKVVSSLRIQHMPSARAQTGSAQSREECTNQKAAAPLQKQNDCGL